MPVERGAAPDILDCRLNGPALHLAYYDLNHTRTIDRCIFDNPEKQANEQYNSPCKGFTTVTIRVRSAIFWLRTPVQSG
jgi:hypothetical protein